MQIGKIMEANVFLQARRGNHDVAINSQGLQESDRLISQYGSSRKVVIFGNHAVAFRDDVFAEIESKFGKAKELNNGAFELSQRGSNYVANWYDTVMQDLGYESADKDKDGQISNQEAYEIKTIIEFDEDGQVFLAKPEAGSLPDNVAPFKNVQDMLNRAMGDDKDKDGIITTAEVKAGETHIDIDELREEALGASIQGQGADAGQIRDKLLAVKKDIEEMRFQGVEKSDPKFRQLQVEERRLISQLARASGYRPVSEKV